MIPPFIRRELPRMSPQQLRWAASAVVNAALLRLPESFLSDDETPEAETIFDRAAFLIEEDLAHVPGCGELAKQCGTSVNTLDRQFKSASGLSVKKYVLAKRMEAAARMIRVEKCSIKETADVLGFADRYHFSKVFRRFFGISPAQFARNGDGKLP